MTELGLIITILMISLPWSRTSTPAKPNHASYWNNWSSFVRIFRHSSQRKRCFSSVVVYWWLGIFSKNNRHSTIFKKSDKIRFSARSWPFLSISMVQRQSPKNSSKRRDSTHFRGMAVGNFSRDNQGVLTHQNSQIS